MDFPSPNPDNRLFFAKITHVAKLDEGGGKCLAATHPGKMEYVQFEGVNATDGFRHQTPLI